ncbi:hypothetical protein KM043_008186 [Ampulex compressa]|nr:hypothetical protein KM043_008186 [Ampulex compressa]
MIEGPVRPSASISTTINDNQRDPSDTDSSDDILLRAGKQNGDDVEEKREERVARSKSGVNVSKDDPAWRSCTAENKESEGYRSTHGAKEKKNERKQECPAVMNARWKEPDKHATSAGNDGGSGSRSGGSDNGRRETAQRQGHD